MTAELACPSVLDGSDGGLVDRIYAAAIDPTRWHDFARELSALCDGAAVAMILLLDEGEQAQMARIGFIESGPGYVERRNDIDIPFSRSPATPDLAAFEFLEDLLPKKQLIASDFYREIMLPRGLAPEAPLVLLLGTRERRPITVIGICRTQNSGVLDERLRQRLNGLVPHLSRAHRIYAELREVRDRRLALAEAIDRFPTGVIVVDSKQRRVFSNQCAERMLELRDGLTLVDERPTAHRSDQAQALREAIAATIAETGGDDDRSPRIVALSRPSGDAPLQLMIAALSDVPDLSDDLQPAAVLFVPDPGSARVETAVLEELYSLTASEAAFIAAFVAERSLEEAAAARGIRTSTARGYLKNAFEKTGTNSQHGLMRLLLTGVGTIRNP